MTRRLADLPAYRDLNVTVMGLGSFGGGVAAVRYFAQRGARVTVTDLRTQSQLTESLESLADVNLNQLLLGGHPEEAFADCDLLVANPAIRPDHPVIVDCKARGVIVTTEIEVFLRHNQGRVIAVTGSNGKSTTATLIHDLLLPMRSDWGCQVFPGGNIGISLLPNLDEIEPCDLVVLELSSFQLEYLRGSGFAPEVAVVTNLSANHLDWHDTFEQYRNAKQVLFDRQTTSQVAVIPGNDEDESATPFRIRGRCLRFGTTDLSEDGAFVEDGLLVLRNKQQEDAFRLSIPRQLPGAHNAQNIAAAACAAWAVGADPERFQKSLSKFEVLPHRLQLVAEGRGLRFYNDSVATTPESAIAALRSFSESIVVLAGGHDKGADLVELCEVLHDRVDAAVLMGDTATDLAAHLADLDNGQGPDVVVADDFRSAFREAVALAQPGGIVLLSPGCASYGWFRDFRDRGQQFIKMSTAWISE